MAEKVILQNLKNFVVKICRSGTNTVVGTGFVVLPDGQIVTCRHVVERATDVAITDETNLEVGVYFPKVSDVAARTRKAVVSKYFPNHDDDVVLLKLSDGPSPLPPEYIAILGEADESILHRFYSYGYRFSEGSRAEGGPAEGIIMGSVEVGENENLQVELVQLKSSEIRGGMSGAPILDCERNLVVGVISATYIRDPQEKHLFADRDTGWAVNIRVLELPPFLIRLQKESLEISPPPQFKSGITRLERIGPPILIKMLPGAPNPLGREWVGRTDLLQAISDDWTISNHRVTGLIGFGGEGKSSLARRWVDNLLLGKLVECPKPDGVFWWSFYDQANVDEFFEVALNYLSGGRIEPRQIPSTNARMNEIAWELRFGRYLFILDGFEVMQYQEGDKYGSIKNADLRQFLLYLAGPEQHTSFGLITSRVPLTDLEYYTTYTHREVSRLSQADGRALLRELGVKDSDKALNRLVETWDGHALTLSLLGSDIAKRYGGKLSDVKDLPIPEHGEGRYEKVRRVLLRYDTHLSKADRAFMTIFSAFRIPVKEIAIKPVFEPAHLHPAAILKRLQDYRLIRHNSEAKYYTMHPLIRNHYYDILNRKDLTEILAIHERIKAYYLKQAEDIPEHPNLEDLTPLIQAVYHACNSGAYEEAHRLLRERINQGNRWVITSQLGAYDTELTILLDFFPKGDVTKNPYGKEASDRVYVLNQAGYSLAGLGRWNEAMPFFERGSKLAMEIEDWFNASITYRNLAELHSLVGLLDIGTETIEQALILARRADNKKDESNLLAYKGWIAHLRGNLNVAHETFQQAEAFERTVNPNARYLSRQAGIQHATHLRLMGDMAYARQVTEANLEICEQNHWLYSISQCYRVLGDLDADTSQNDSAKHNYNEAVKIARSTSQRNVLIQGLLARGRFWARLGEIEPARSDLEEGLSYVLEGGQRIYEVDIRIGLALMYLAVAKEPGEIFQIMRDWESVRQQAETALSMSEEMGYYWGKIEAKEVFDILGKNLGSCVNSKYN